MSKLETLQDRVSELEQICGFDMSEQLMACGLKLYEARIVALLLKRHSVVSKDSLLIAAYLDRPVDDRPEPPIIDVYMVRIRKALEPHGIEIETMWGYGFLMRPASKQRLRELLSVAV